MSFFFSRQKHVYSELRLELQRAVYCRTKYWSASDLKAPVWRLFWYPEPGCYINVENQDITLQPDEIYLIPSDVSFGGHQKKPLEEFHILFNFTPSLVKVAKPYYRFSVYPEFLQLMNELASSKQVNNHDPLLSIQANAILSHCLQQIPKDDWQFQIFEARLLKVIKTMSELHHQPPSNQQLATLIGMSESAFIRYFSKEMGTPPQQYFNRLRVEHAECLLAATDLPLETIANECGFSDKSHLSRQFKKYCQCTPGAYRSGFLE